MFGLDALEVTQLIENWFKSKCSTFKNEVIEKVTENVKKQAAETKAEIFEECQVILTQAQEILFHAQAIDTKVQDALKLSMEAIEGVNNVVDLVDYVKQNADLQAQFIKRAASIGVQQQERMNQVLDRLDKSLARRVLLEEESQKIKKQALRAIDNRTKAMSTIKTKKKK